MVPGWIPAGKLVAMVGNGGTGKSTISLSMAADLSQGRPMLGLEYPKAAQGESLVISCEDDFADTINPRLLALGADLDKIHQVEGVALANGNTCQFSLSAFQAMESHLERKPAINLVIVDPAGAFIGDKDDHKDAELRQLLDPLAEVAARRNVVIVLVKHLNKSASPQAVNRVSGSTAWVNVVRSCLLFAPSPDDPEVIVVAQAKCNLARKQSAIAYRFEPLSEGYAAAIHTDKLLAHLDNDERNKLIGQMFYPHWIKDVKNISADDLLSAKRDSGGSKVQRATTWLLDLLQEFAFPDNEILEAAKHEGFTFDNIKKAKSNLKQGHHLQSTNLGRFGGTWWHGIGKPSEWKLRPESESPESLVPPD
jgi:hypothetical protein